MGGGHVYIWDPNIRFGLIANTTATSKNPSLGTDYASKIALAYQESNLIYAMTNTGTGWSAREAVSPEQIDPDFEAHRTPSVAVDNSARPVVAWEYYNGEVLKSFVRVRRRESGGWGVTTSFMGIKIGSPPYFYNYEPSISSHPKVNDDFAVSWYTNQSNVQLRERTGSSWGPVQIIGDPGYEPNLSQNNAATKASKVVYRNSNSSPYSLTFVWPPPSSPLGDMSDKYREITVEGDSFSVRFKVGELVNSIRGVTQSIPFSSFPDTTVLYRPSDAERVLSTDAFVVDPLSVFGLYWELEVVNATWVQNNWTSSSHVIMRIDAIDSLTGETIDTLAGYRVSRSRIPSVSGYTSIPLSTLAGRTVKLAVRTDASEDLTVIPMAVDEHVPAEAEMAKLLAVTQEPLPQTFSLGQNFPNPFNPSTTISYGLPEGTNVNLKIYDILGREVLMLVDGFNGAGYHEVTVDGTRLSTGVYVYRLNAGSFTDVKKLIVLK